MVGWQIFVLQQFLYLEQKVWLMKQPRVVFSKWVNWSKRDNLERINSPGMYLLAKFTNPPTGRADPKDKDIIYIGETCGSLAGRWRQFGRSAKGGVKGHTGGQSYFEKFKGELTQLYVAAFPVNEFEGDNREKFIRYVERKLIWEFVKEHGKAPVLNIK